MAGRDGPIVDVLLRIPGDLRMLAERYQSTRRLPSLNAAIRELLETHPAIATELERVYASLNTVSEWSND